MTRRYWLTSELKYLKRVYPTKTPLSEIQDKLGRPAGSIYKKAEEAGLKRPNLRELDCFNRVDLNKVDRQLKDPYATLASMAEALDVSVYTIRRVLMFYLGETGYQQRFTDATGDKISRSQLKRYRDDSTHCKPSL